MQPDLIADTFRCTSCGFFKSELAVLINLVTRIDEEKRARALKSLRDAGFRQLLDACSDILPRGSTALDVGCAHGWFIEAARARGYLAVGIEPDVEIANRARAIGVELIIGLFPDALPENLTFDVITFNDVFEHLPDVNATLRSTCSRVNPGGLVVITLPVSDGLVFNLARLAARIGIKAPLERMWQKGLPSPHLSYFSRKTLLRVTKRTGLSVIRDGPVQAITAASLYDRIRYDRNVGRVRAAITYMAALAVLLIARAFPSDIHYFIFRKA
jgi:SAM-dependent methyltransferase